MTQLPEEGAVGGSDEPIIAAEPTLEDRFAAIADQVEEPTAAEDGPEPEDLTADEETATEAEADEEPPIQPPVSWKDEEKEEFKNLPRALQETLTRREAEREKFVQSKAQEAAQARSTVEREALATIGQINAQYEQQLRLVVPQVPEKPSYQLQIDDPIAFAEQMDAHERAVAQYGNVQQQLQLAQHRQQQVAAEIHQREQAETHAILTERFPEYLDPTEGPKLRQQLGSIAIELGYSAEQLANVDANDILAMRHVANLKAKADKYDALMTKQMEKVREAKKLPSVSKPGVPQGKGAVENSRYVADRTAMKSGDQDAAKRVFARFI